MTTDGPARADADDRLTSSVSAWRHTCERLTHLADLFGPAPTPDQSPHGQAPGPPLQPDSVEAVEHLVDQVTLWLAWETLHANPTRPFFHRHNDLVSQWGGPNADNVYRHARVEPGRRYRVRGNMHSCSDFILATRAGFMHEPVWGTKFTFTASEHGIGPGDSFDLIIGPDGGGISSRSGHDHELPSTATVPLDEGVAMVSVREYYFDWVAEEPAVFTIECLDPEPPTAGPLPTSAAFSERLDRSLDQMGHSLRYWARYLNDNRAQRTDNSFAVDTVTVAKGLALARYEFCFWDLDDDQALIIEADPPDARYWALQLYAMNTFELVDLYGSVTSRNHRQSTPSDDGRVRFVLSAVDPGAPNWLDTTGRRNGLCTFRWFWPNSDRGANLSTQVAPVDEVRHHLPSGTVLVDADERARELASRQAHLRWRFRA